MSVNEDNFLKWLADGYPRPQLCRPIWYCLNGQWDFNEDPNDEGMDARWYLGCEKGVFEDSIEVPFPPGSKLSGYNWKQTEHDSSVVWYRRTVTAKDLPEFTNQSQWILNFEAVDHECDVWVNEQHVVHHKGGYTPFTAELEGEPPFEIVLRAKDDRCTAQPRGKQSWRDDRDGIWYERSTGIWRDVWIESRPRMAIEEVFWRADLEREQLVGEFTLSATPKQQTQLSIKACKDSVCVAEVSVQPQSRHCVASIPIPQLKNNMDAQNWLWAPQHPNLVDLYLTLESEEGVDKVVSYAGLRSVHVSESYMHITGEPIYLRGVLDQGYWPESFFTPPTPTALEDEIKLILGLGFNMSRVHERTPDRRYVAWADVYGLLLWAEFPSSYIFADSEIMESAHEWLNYVRRDRSSPSIVAWVPFNESWGVPSISTNAKQRSYVEGLVKLTKALDDSRPVCANDGWEQPDTDIVTIHDYANKPEQLKSTYETKEALQQSVNGVGPQGRRTYLDGNWNFDKPVVVSEFGGIALANGNSDQWGYRTVQSKEEFEETFEALFSALLESPHLAGFCYTQLADTAQEANGICTYDRIPKISVEKIQQVVTSSTQHDTQVRPRVITEHAMGWNDK